MRNTSERKRIAFIKYRHKHRHRVKIKPTTLADGKVEIESTGCDLQLPSSIHPKRPTSCATKPERSSGQMCDDAQISTSGDASRRLTNRPLCLVNEKISIHLILHLLCLVFLVPPQPVRAFCPPKCICDDQHLSANCTQVPSISFVPMTFNPLLRHLTLNQLPMYELSNSLSFYRQLENLDLKSNQIRQITYQNFNFKPASTAILTNHKYTDTTSQGNLHTFNNTHEVLDYNLQVAKNLKQAIIKSLDPATGSGLSDNEDEIKFHLKSLDLSDNRIEELGSVTGDSDLLDGSTANLQSPPREDYQRIKSVVLEKTSPFLTLTKLERLGLSGNRLSHLHKHVFLGLVQLSSLDLSRNNIEHIDKHAFVGLIELKELDLGNNKLARQLGHISISLCRAPMNELRALNLGKNLKGATGSSEVILPNQMFICAPKLNELNLDALNLQYIQVNAFDNLQALETLNLSQNYLEQVPSESLRSSASVGKTLKQLDLSDNLIEFVNADAFASLRALERLYMNSMLRLVSFDLASLNTNSKPGARFGRGSAEVAERDSDYSLPSALKIFPLEHLFKRQLTTGQDQTVNDPRDEPSNNNLIELQLMHNIRLVSLHSSLAAGLGRPSVKMRFYRWEVLNLSGATELHELPLADMIELQQLPRELHVDLSYASHLNCSSCQMDWLIRAARQRLIEVSRSNQQQSFSTPLLRDWNLILFDKQNPYATQPLSERVVLTSDTTGCFAPFNVPLMEFARIVETNLDRCINQQSAPAASANKQPTKNPSFQPLPSSNNFPTTRTVMEQQEQTHLDNGNTVEETSRLLRQQQQTHGIASRANSSGDGAKQIYSLLVVIALLVVLSAIVLKLVYTFLIRRPYGLKWRSPSSVTTSIDSPSSFQQNNFNQNLDRCLNQDNFLYDSTSYTSKHVPLGLHASHIQQRLDRCDRTKQSRAPIFNSIAFQTNVGPIERTRKRNDLFSRIASFWHRTDQTQTLASTAAAAVPATTTKQLPSAINGLLPGHHWSLSSAAPATAAQSARKFPPGTTASILASHCNEFQYGNNGAGVIDNGDEILSGQISRVAEQSNYYLAPQASNPSSYLAQNTVNSNTKVIEAGHAGHKVLLPDPDENKFRRENWTGNGVQRGDPSWACNKTSGPGVGPLIGLSSDEVGVGAGELNYGNVGACEDLIYANGQERLAAFGRLNSPQARKIQSVSTTISTRAHDEVQSRQKQRQQQQQLEALNMVAGGHSQQASSACQSANSSMVSAQTLALHHQDRSRQTTTAVVGNSMSSTRNSEQLASCERYSRREQLGTASSSSSAVLETVGNYKSSHGTKENGSRNPNANDSSHRARSYRQRDEADTANDGPGQVVEEERKFVGVSVGAKSDARGRPQQTFSEAHEEESFVGMPRSSGSGDATESELFADDGHIYVTLDSRPIKQQRRQRAQLREDDGKDEEEDDYEAPCAVQSQVFEHELSEATSPEVVGPLSAESARGTNHPKTGQGFGSQLDSGNQWSAVEQSSAVVQAESGPKTETLRLEQLISVKNHASTNSSDSGLGMSSATNATNVAHRKYGDPRAKCWEPLAMSTGNCVSGSRANASSTRIPSNVNDKDETMEQLQGSSEYSNYACNDAHVIGQSERFSVDTTSAVGKAPQQAANRRVSNKGSLLDASDGSNRRANYAINDPSDSLKSSPMKQSREAPARGTEHKAQFEMGSNVFNCDSQQLFAGVNTADRSRLPAATAVAPSDDNDGVRSVRTDMCDRNDGTTTTVHAVKGTQAGSATATFSKYDANHARRGQPEVGRWPLSEGQGNGGDGDAVGCGDGDESKGGDDRGSGNDYVINGRVCGQNKRSAAATAKSGRRQRQRQQMDHATGGTDATATNSCATTTDSVTEGGNEYNNEFGQTSSRNRNYVRRKHNADDFADRQDSILIGQHANGHMGAGDYVDGAVMFGKSADCAANNVELTRTDSTDETRSQWHRNEPVISAFNSGPLGATATVCGDANDKQWPAHKQKGRPAQESEAGCERSRLVRGANNQQNNCDSQQGERTLKRLQTTAATTRSNHTHTTNTLGFGSSSAMKPNKQQQQQHTSASRAGGNEIYSSQFYYCRPSSHATIGNSATLTRNNSHPSSK